MHWFHVGNPEFSWCLCVCVLQYFPMEMNKYDNVDVFAGQSLSQTQSEKHGTRHMYL